MTTWRSIPDQLFQKVFTYLDSCTLYRLVSISKWFQNAIAGSESLWRYLITKRFPMITINAPDRDDYYHIHRQIDQNRLKLLRFGGIPPEQRYDHHPDSSLRIPSGYKSIRSVACGGFFFIIHTTTWQLIVITDHHHYDILFNIDEYRCGRNSLFYRSGPSWFFRRNVMTYHTRSQDIKLPDRIRHIEIGWEKGIFLTDSKDLHIISHDVQIWNVPMDIHLFGCGEGNIVIVNKSGLYQSNYDEQSWSLLYSFKLHQKPIRLKVWFRSIALETSQGWVVKLPKSDDFVELSQDVCDVHLGDWHYVYIMANGDVWSGGDFCRRSNLGAQDKPVAGPVDADWRSNGIALEYSCAGWQTLILYLENK